VSAAVPQHLPLSLSSFARLSTDIAMHKALLVEDIVIIILNHLRKSDLSHVATTCRALSKLALDILWTELHHNMLPYLAISMAPGTHTEKRVSPKKRGTWVKWRVVMRRPGRLHEIAIKAKEEVFSGFRHFITATKIQRYSEHFSISSELSFPAWLSSRFLTYAKRIQKIALDIYDEFSDFALGDSVYDAWSHYIVEAQASLFPKLGSIRVTFSADYSNRLPAISFARSLLSTSQLHSFSMTYGFKEAVSFEAFEFVNSLNHILPIVQPKLKNITLLLHVSTWLPPEGDTEHQESLMRLLSDKPELAAITCDIVVPLETLKTISNLRMLTHLNIHANGRFFEADERRYCEPLPPGGFLALRELHLVHRSLEDLCSSVRSLECSAYLRTLSCALGFIPDEYALFSFTRVLTGMAQKGCFHALSDCCLKPVPENTREPLKMTGLSFTTLVTAFPTRLRCLTLGVIAPAFDSQEIAETFVAACNQGHSSLASLKVSIYTRSVGPATLFALVRRFPRIDIQLRLMAEDIQHIASLATARRELHSEGLVVSESVIAISIDRGLSLGSDVPNAYDWLKLFFPNLQPWDRSS
jgi:hypothetical protein